MAADGAAAVPPLAAASTPAGAGAEHDAGGAAGSGRAPAPSCTTTCTTDGNGGGWRVRAARGLWSALHCLPARLLLWAASLPPAHRGVMWREEEEGEGGAAAPRCFLTIDDAPGRDLRQMHELLDLLRDEGTVATFFVIASHVDSDDARAWLRRAVREGHGVGNHLTADAPSPRDAAAFAAALDACERVLCDAAPGYAARRVKWFRAPHAKVHGGMAPVLAARRYVSVLGDVYAHDPQLGPGDPLWVSSFLAAHARAGSVVVCHAPDPACSPPRHFLPIYADLLPRLRAKGLRAATLDDAAVPRRCAPPAAVRQPSLCGGAAARQGCPAANAPHGGADDGG